MIVFRVDGLPIPQGSMTISRSGGKTWMRPANAARLKPWREKVAAAADVGHTFDCPVEVFAVFYLPKPQRPRWWVPAVKPDLDKLLRSLHDGLVDGGLLSDDSRVVAVHSYKRYATLQNPVGVRVVVMEKVEGV